MPDEIQAVAHWVPVTTEQLKAYGAVPLTAEEQERSRLAEAAYAAEREVAVQQHRALLGSTTGVRRAVLELHGPVDDSGWLVCEGCDGYEYPPDWPCRTYVLVRDTEGE